MRVQAEVLSRVAELARLRLEPEEAERLRQELSGILDHMDSLAQVDGLTQPDETAPECAPSPDTADQRGPNGSAEGSTSATRHPPAPLLVDPSQLAPQWEEEFFVVPRLPAMDGTMNPPPPLTYPSPGEGQDGG